MWNELLNMAWPLILLAISVVIFLVGVIVSIAYLTLFERKVLAASQMRWGANVIGPFGLFQPFADGIKLMHKEVILPKNADVLLFLLAPALTFGLSLASWAVIPFGDGLVFSNINLGVLYLLAVSSMGVLGIIMAGWASNSVYSIYGGLRAAAQMISYEVSMGVIVLSVVMSAQSFNLSAIVNAQKTVWFIIPHFPMFVVFFISTLAETNRTPFDLPEAEAELAGGFNVEYSATPFGAFFLGEYGNMIAMSAFTSVLFLGGWLPPFNWWLFAWIPGPMWMGLKITFLLFVFLWVRATLPRYRYDQLMNIGWKVFLPFSLVWLCGTAVVLLWLNGGGGHV
jgi:NADH-quinone oxidoreductase subunit H